MLYDYNPLTQGLEDARWDRHIEREARRLFNEWELLPIHTLQSGERVKLHFPLPAFPTPPFYYIVDEQEAKYKNVNINKLILERVAQLKAEVVL